jgi:citrate/tricarballylate utilization protein
MERRVTFAEADLAYLANLCHDCGECLYACQYAPPHEFGINVPKTLAEIRVRSYEEHCWPRFLGAAFRHHGLFTALLLAAGCALLLLALTMMVTGDAVWRPGAAGDFYAVVPHGVMVGLFGGVFVFAAAALGLRPDLPAALSALHDAMTLRYLHGNAAECTEAEERRGPWRRWFHHCTFYGFALCFASTTVAAVYHTLFGWVAPYDYTSVPVILGTIGGLGLVVGPFGLLVLRTRRDSNRVESSRRGLDESFITLLLLTSVTGLVLLAARHQATMGLLLIVHLGAVLALFLTLPYGKFVHGFYRLVALAVFAAETKDDVET